MSEKNAPSEFDYLSSEMQERIIALEKEVEAIKRERLAWQKLSYIWATNEKDLRENEIMYLEIIRFALEMDHHNAHDIAELEYLAKKVGLEDE